MQKKQEEKEKTSILHKKISKTLPKQAFNYHKSPQKSEEKFENSPEKFERKVTRLLQKTLSTNKNQRNNIKENSVSSKPSLEFKFEESEEILNIKNNIVEKNDQSIDIIENTPQTPENIENQNLETENDDKTLFFKMILKELWFCLDGSKAEFEVEIINIQNKVKDCMGRIATEFQSVKKEKDYRNCKTFQIYIQGYGNFLSGIDYILKISQKNSVYKKYFEYIHQDIISLYDELKSFIYLNYLKLEKPDGSQRKSSNHLNSFEGFKENSSEKKLSLELIDELNENQSSLFRKKFLVHMAKAFQTSYKIDKEKSKLYALKIHSLLLQQTNSEHFAIIHNKGIKLVKILKVIFKTLLKILRPIY